MEYIPTKCCNFINCTEIEIDLYAGSHEDTCLEEQ